MSYEKCPIPHVRPMDRCGKPHTGSSTCCGCDPNCWVDSLAEFSFKSNKRLKIEDLKEEHKGKTVTYIPLHAHGDVEHEDCEIGEISSFNDKYVFVKYKDKRSGWIKETSQATDPSDLCWGSRPCNCNGVFQHYEECPQWQMCL